MNILLHNFKNVDFPNGTLIAERSLDSELKFESLCSVGILNIFRVTVQNIHPCTFAHRASGAPHLILSELRFHLETEQSQNRATVECLDPF